MSGAPAPRRHRGRPVLRWTLRIVLVLSAGLGALVFAATRAPVALPAWVTGRLAAARLAALKGRRLLGLAGRRRLRLPRTHGAGHTGGRRTEGGRRTGTPLLTLDQITAIVALRRLAAGTRSAPTAVQGRGAEISLGRDEEGRLTVRLGGQTVMSGVPSPGALLDVIRNALSTPRLAGLSAIGVEDVSRASTTCPAMQLASRGGYLLDLPEQGR